MKNFKDIEQLSAYLDGHLSPVDSARLESRLSSDPELASALSDIRAARGILRKMPKRKAPRNFTLTRQMVGLKPPLPQSYSFFRFSTALASILLLLTFAANSLPRASFYGGAAPAQSFAFCNGCGGGSGGGSDVSATEAPAATEAPMAAEAPSIEMAVAPTESLPEASADSSRIGESPTAEAPMPKDTANESGSPDQSQVQPEAVIPSIWQFILLTLGLVSGLIMFVLRKSAMQKWK